MSFTSTAQLDYLGAHDTPAIATQYITYCEAVHRVAIWISDDASSPRVYLDSTTCAVTFSPETVNTLAKLAAEHGVLPDVDLDDFCAFEFSTIDHAERFAQTAADWLRQTRQMEPQRPLRSGPYLEYYEYSR